MEIRGRLPRVMGLLAVSVLLAGCPLFWTVGWYRIVETDGDSVAKAVALLPDGSFAIAGSAENGHDEDDNVLFMLFNATGGVVRQSEYGDERNDTAHDIQRTSDGGFILAGQFGGHDDDTQDGFLIKIRPDGILQWQITLDSGGRDYIQDVHPTADGGYIVSAQLDELGDAEAVMIKYNAQGTELWRVSAGPATNVAQSAIVADGGAVLCAWTLGVTVAKIPAQHSIILVKAGQNGTEAWRKTIVSDTALVAEGIAPAHGGGVIVCGQDDFLSGDSKSFLLKTNSDGNVEWKNTYGGNSRESLFAVQAVSDGGYAAAGEVLPPDETPHGYMIKVNDAGIKTWEKAYGGDNDDFFYDFAVIESPLPGSINYLAVGKSESYSLDNDPSDTNVFVVRTNAAGEVPLASRPVTK